MSDIDPAAIVEEGARLGAEVTVGPFAIIEAGAVVGDGCDIGPHAVIGSRVRLGARCRVHAHAVLGDVPQDLAFAGCESFVEIGAGTVIREGVTIHRGTRAWTSTVVGEGCYLMANSHLGHNVHLGPRVIVANGALLGGYVEVGAGAFISGNCLIHQFVRIGRLVMLSGGSGVGKDVPPFLTTRGLKPNRVTGVNTVGLRRAGVGPEDRRQIKRAFMLLYRSGLNVGQAVERIRAELNAAPALEMCDFIEASKRGICPAVGAGGDAAEEGE